MNVLITTLNSKFIHTNLAIRYLKAMIEDIINVEMEEYTINMDLNVILKDIYSKKPDILILSTYIWNLDSSLKIAKTIKEIMPNIKILMGGPEVSFNVESFMYQNPFIDYIIYGEGEETLYEFIECLKNNTGIENVRGLAYKKGNQVLINASRALIEDLDFIKTPYKKISEDDYKNKIVYYETSRGCPFNCEYCLSSALKGIRFFSLERVKSDIRQLMSVGVKQIKFIDRTFNIGSKRTIELIEFLMSIDDGNVNFHLEIAAHVMDDDIVEFLSKPRIGLFQFEIGVQSTNEETLKEIGRYQDFEKLKNVVEKINSYKNIHQHLDLIVGLPYEDYFSFEKSFNDVFNLNIGHLQVGFLKLLKGSPLEKKIEKHGIKYRKYPPYEVLETAYITYDQVQKIKEVEEILEVYWNSKNFSKSMRYLLAVFYNKQPFKMFEEISRFWSEKKLFEKSHNKNDLYNIFLDFYLDKKFINVNFFKELLRLDYLSLGKTSYIPERLKTEINKIEDFGDKCHKFLQDEMNLNKFLPEYLNTPAKNIIKKVHFECFLYDIEDIEKNEYHNIVENDSVMMFAYDLDKKIFEKSRVIKVKLG